MKARLTVIVFVVAALALWLRLGWAAGFQLPTMSFIRT